MPDSTDPTLPAPGDQSRARCKARRRDGNQCQHWPMKGQQVCRMHGGSAPQMRAAAARRLERAAIEDEWRKLALGDVVPVDPGDALLDAVSWTAAMVGWLRLQLAQIELENVAWGRTKHVEKMSGLAPGSDYTYEARPHVLLAMVGEWTDRLGQLSALAIRAGVEVRRVELAEKLGEAMATAMNDVLVGLGLDDTQLTSARAALVGKLSVVVGAIGAATA